MTAKIGNDEAKALGRFLEYEIPIVADTTSAVKQDERLAFTAKLVIHLDVVDCFGMLGCETLSAHIRADFGVRGNVIFARSNPALVQEVRQFVPSHKPS